MCAVATVRVGFPVRNREWLEGTHNHTGVDMSSSLPSTLLAILIAARRGGDRDLERQVRRTLDDEHGIRISFARGENDKPKGGSS